MAIEDEQFDLVPTDLAIEAMRDNGYKNAAYAIAELIDNSIQAGASSVELLILEKDEFRNQKVTRNVSQVAVLDNGSGMNESHLRAALQFGNGSRLNDRSGIGRFGMGLPSASVSQCRMVEVWSWVNGPQNAIYSYIDLGKVARKEQKDVPKPEFKAVPEIWTEASVGVLESGTLVVWSDIDRCMWKTGKAIIDNSEFIIGRMYRKFLSTGHVNIRMAAFLDDTPHNPHIDRPAIANDPGYLIAPTSTPSPWDSKSMFKPDGADGGIVTLPIQYMGELHEVHLQFSIANEEARRRPDGGNPGDTDYGRHARKNQGISISRAGRELEIDQSICNASEPTERWWGVEVEFPPSLDGLFGVSNDKQSARNFTDVLDKIDDILGGKKSIASVKQDFEDDNDPRIALIDVAHEIVRRVRQMRSSIKIQTKGTRGPKRFDDAEHIATRVTDELKKAGKKGQSDEEEDRPPEDRKHEIQLELEESGLGPDEAKNRAESLVDEAGKYIAIIGELDGSQFFTVKPRAGVIHVTLNRLHPAYENLIEVVETDDLESIQSLDELRKRLERAGTGLKLLLFAWARFEDEQIDGDRRRELQEIRLDWGRYLEKFLKPNN